MKTKKIYKSKADSSLCEYEGSYLELGHLKHVQILIKTLLCKIFAKNFYMFLVRMI